MDNKKVSPPQYPSVAGQKPPALNLAGELYPPPVQNMPLANPTMSTPSLNTEVPAISSDASSLHVLGIDPGTPYFQLNLAGNEMNIPSPASLAAAQPVSRGNAPTYGTPNFAVPGVESGADATGLTLSFRPPFQIDPDIPDLAAISHPAGLDMLAASDLPMAPDPMAPDLNEYDRPAGLAMPGPLMVDPQLPDLQSPDSSLEVEMPDRPGDLAPGALTILHGLPTYQMIPADSYEELWMAQAGNNQARERHMGMLMRGLDREES